MLDFEDPPYQFHPGHPRRAWVWISHLLNRWSQLPHAENRISEVVVNDPHGASPRMRDGRTLVLVNHSHHADACVMFEAFRRWRVSSYFMAAYEVHLKSWAHTFLLPRLGVFTVDRDGADTKSMSFASNVLLEGRHPLTIFPEGNVSLQNERLVPFLNGASLLALKAQRELGKEKPITILPVSINYTLLDDCRNIVRKRIEFLAAEARQPMRHAAALRDEMARIGLHLLETRLEQHGHQLPGDGTEEKLNSGMQACAAAMISRLEHELGINPKEGTSLSNRIRKVRESIHLAKIRQEAADPPPLLPQLSSLAMLALRILSYDGRYVMEKQTLDRFAETSEKIAEDWSGKIIPATGNRRAIVTICEPIPLTDHLDAFSSKARPAVENLTGMVEQRVQESLTNVAATLDTPGAQLF